MYNFLENVKPKLQKNGGRWEKMEFVFVLRAPEISRNTSLLALNFFRVAQCIQSLIC